MQKKKIMICANHYITIYAFRKELAERLREYGYDVILSYPEYNGEDKFEKSGFKHVKIEIDRRGLNPVKDIKTFISYLKILSEYKPDVVLTYTIKPNIYGGAACRLKKIPYLVNITGLGSAFEKGNFIKKILVKMYRYAMKKCNCIFFQNKENQDSFCGLKITGKKNRLIPGSGVNLQKFVPFDYPNNNNFVFIARIMKEKGIEEYIKTAEYIKEKYPDACFHICGFCEEKYENIILELQKKGIVVYHGMVDDVREILKNICCIINPSYHEGMSNVLEEAAACAIPGICSDISGCREIVENEKTGFLFEAENAESLICMVERFINLSYEERKRMGTEARRKMEREFDREFVINAYLQEVEMIITGEQSNEKLV